MNGLKIIGISFGVFFSSLLALAPLCIASGAVPRLDSKSIYVAEAKKNKHYVSDGVITGGDRTVNDVAILGIRHAKNNGFERIVIDLDTEKKKAPYFHVSMSGDMHQLSVTLWGSPKLGFNAHHVKRAFAKSNLVERVVLLPPLLEENRWTFVLHMKKDASAEVFELSDPLRLILDLRS